MDKLTYQKQVESRLLCCLLKDNELIKQLRVTHNDFIDENHQYILKGILHLADKGSKIDNFALLKLGKTSIARMGGSQTITEVFNELEYVDVDVYTTLEKQIVDFNVIANARQIANEFLMKTQDETEMEHLKGLYQELASIEGRTIKKTISTKERFQNRASSYYELKKEGLSGIPTGLMSLDRVFDGLQRSELIVIGARPSLGKTAFAVNIMNNILLRNAAFPTFFCIDMDEDYLFDRFVALNANVQVQKMRNVQKACSEEEKAMIYKMTGMVEKFNWDVNGVERTVQGMRAVVRKNMKDNPNQEHVVFIDFLTNMKGIGKFQSRHHEIEDIVLSLKEMAKELKVTIILLAQLSRGLENRENKRPGLSDLRESGSIEQTADSVMFLHREDYFNQADRMKPEQELEVIVAKNRNGTTPVLKYKFIAGTNKIEEGLVR